MTARNPRRPTLRTLEAAIVALLDARGTARKFLQMGVTRARRYANHRTGRKYARDARELPRDPDAAKAASAEVSRAVLDRARRNRTYLRLRKQHEALAQASTARSSARTTTRA